MLTVSSKYFIEGYASLLVFFLVYVKRYRVFCVSVQIHLKIVQEKLLFFAIILFEGNSVSTRIRLHIVNVFLN